MPSTGPADFAWLTNVRATFDLIQNHIPISDVALIVQDYLATPMPRYSSQCCFRCKAYHRRHISNLCTACSTVCLVCDRLVCQNERITRCCECFDSGKHSNTINLLKSLQSTQTKSESYGAWYGAQFYSDILRNTQTQLRREAADPILRAAKEKRDKEIAEFHAIENAKPMVERYIDCRQKLWDAYEELNKLRKLYPSAGITAKPEFPFH